MKKETISIIGCGNMGGALVRALVRARVYTPNAITVYDTRDEVATKLSKECAVRKAKTLQDAICGHAVVVLGIKPQNLDECSARWELRWFRTSVVVSLLAGTTLKRLEKACGRQTRIIRTMPNVGIMVGEGITALCKNTSARKTDLLKAQRIFEACGKTILAKESLMDVVTAVSGSGPAYFFYLTELLMEEAMKRGIAAHDAYLLAAQTLSAASSVLKQGGSPAEWRSRVTSRGGTTEAAFTVLGSKPFKGLVNKALDCAVARARMLSQ